MKNAFLLTISIVLSLSLGGQNLIKLNNLNTEQISLISSTPTSTTIQFSLSEFSYDFVETSKGNAWKISSPKGVSMLNEGAPELPMYATSLIIPGQARMEVKIISSSFTEYENILVSPSKGNLLRTVDPSSVEYNYGKTYNVDSFYPRDIGLLREPYIVRDFRGQTLVINPMQYNPVTKILRVYHDITFQVMAKGTSSINTLDTEPRTVYNEFSNIYQHHFINYNDYSRYTPVEESGNMLIISYADFMDEMQPFIDWKIMSGTPVEMVDVSTIGNSSDIKQYITEYYNNNGLTYVLLIGDSQQVPSSTIGGNDSDVDYSYTAGNDHYPDLFVGRFSAETEAHVSTQVTRVLDYEQTPSSDTAWYSKAIGIASQEGTGDDGEYDYEHIRNIGDNKLIPFTYDYAYEFFEGSQGGNDSIGNPSSTMVGNAINSGATIINYTGHGSTSSWATSGFSSYNVSNLTNNEKLPFIFSVACVNGNFVNSYCFAEAWMRAENNGEPAGAIATLMSTINQSWNPPMRGQDEMNDILTEAYSDNIKRTFGGISMNGCMNMNDVYGNGGYTMTDTWTIFGDPSLEIRTAAPQTLTVTHLDTIPLGTTSLTVNCDQDGSFATLSMDGEILGSETIENGVAVISFDAISNPGMADIVVTSFNYYPYISTIEVVSAPGPFVIYASNVINDATGNNNGLMDYGESILLTVGMTNSGNEDAVAITTTITTTSEYIELIDSVAFYGDIPSGDTVSVTDAFSFNVANNIPDIIIANFTVIAEDGSGNIWESTFMLTAHAPVLVFTGFDIDDSNGNSNGKIEPGETVNIILETTNIGSSEAYNVTTQLSSSSPFVELDSDPQLIGNIASGESATSVTSITADGSTPEGTLAQFFVDINADMEITGEGEFETVIGQKALLLVNLSESPSSDSMQTCLQNLQVGFDLAYDLNEELGIYKSVFILLGIYPNNYTLSSAEGDILKQYMESGGRVYMEGGDTWAFDDQTSAHEMFHIVGITDGSNDLGTLLGKDNSIMDGFDFSYEGNNNYIDHISADAESVLIFENTQPIYGTGVSFENDIYRTIGTSFEFAGLQDNPNSSKDELMAEILFFFGIDFIYTNTEDITSSFPGIKSFPNPASDYVSFNISLPGEEAITITLYDINGSKVDDIITNKLFNDNQTIKYKINNIKPGIYFYNFTAGNYNITQKMVIVK